ANPNTALTHVITFNYCRRRLSVVFGVRVCQYFINHDYGPRR
ncbi:hypothetical protein A2U01_0038404, partial [Trifolium medium]|nr:hypothetical protein [Trifolium medium]